MKSCKIELTDDEWIRLLYGGDEESLLGKCCANISALRDELFKVVRSGRNEEIDEFTIDRLKRAMKWVADGHDLNDTLLSICKQIDFDPRSATHEKDKYGE